MQQNFERLVKERQSCREYNGKPVQKETLDKVLDLALLSPSACNSQPWKLIAVTSKEKADAVRECLQYQGHNKFLTDVNCFVAVVDCQASLKPTIESKFDRNRFVKYDVGEITAYLTLGAKAYGLDTCIIGWMDEKTLREVLSLGENEVCTMVVAVGYSDCPTRDKIRKPKTEKVKYI